MDMGDFHDYILVIFLMLLMSEVGGSFSAFMMLSDIIECVFVSLHTSLQLTLSHALEG